MTTKKSRKAIRRRAIVAAMIGGLFVAMYVGVGFATFHAEAPAETVEPAYVLVPHDVYVGSMSKWDVSDEDVELIATVVMSVARGELPVVQQAVAQCLRTTCEELDMSVAEAVKTYGWPTYCEIAADEAVYEAIEKVVNGFPAIDTDIYFCYNPSIQAGEWHETQTFVAKIGSLRFFTENN